MNRKYYSSSNYDYSFVIQPNSIFIRFVNEGLSLEICDDIYFIYKWFLNEPPKEIYSCSNAVEYQHLNPEQLLHKIKTILTFS